MYKLTIIQHFCKDRKELYEYYITSLSKIREVLRNFNIFDEIIFNEGITISSNGNLSAETQLVFQTHTINIKLESIEII